MITNTQSGTNINEIADGIFRINTPMTEMPGGFSFNQFLIVDEEPLLFHNGMRKLFPLVREAIDAVMPVARIRYLSFSHFEADECGALNEFLAVAPDAVPLCSRVAAMVSVSDFADRPPLAIADDQSLTIGKHQLVWMDAPHVPHGWETGYLFEKTTKTLFSGDLFTLPGIGAEPLIESDLVDAAEGARAKLAEIGLPDYWAHSRDEKRTFERFASLGATTIANMHGSSWRGPAAAAAAMIRELGRRISIQ